MRGEEAKGNTLWKQLSIKSYLKCDLADGRLLRSLLTYNKCSSRAPLLDSSSGSAKPIHVHTGRNQTKGVKTSKRAAQTKERAGERGMEGGEGKKRRERKEG